MKLFKLLKGIKCRVLGSVLIEIGGLFHNDKDVKTGGLFFCLNGQNNDGINFVNTAVELGAVAVVSEKEIRGLRGVTQILVKDARKTMSLMAINFYGNPAKDLKLVGVTGTNGKTTTTHMIAGILNNLGYISAIIGTNGVIYKDKKIETGMTTPDPIELQKILRQLVDSGVKFVCMEVSAHSIFLKKIEGLKFEIMLFSNLTEDHLNFFKTMELYFETKKKVFTKKYSKQVLINIDDRYGKMLFESINVRAKTYSIYNDSDYFAKNLGVDNFVQKFKFRDKIISSKFLGEFNVYNLLSAIVCVEMLGFKIKDVQKIVDLLEFVLGRFNAIVINKKLFIIDYAHTPDGLENVLRLCRNIAGENKLLCVFGCGGNRETQKRSKMGEISSKYADFTIITSDNPRFEDRFKIAQDIESGMTNDKYKIILDRIEAIRLSDELSKIGDIILIAGKGSENYIDERGEKKYYSDYEQVESLRK